MVPIQTILALLAVLMMLSGCSQKAPPGSTWKPKALAKFTPITTTTNGNSGSQGASVTPGNSGSTHASSGSDLNVQTEPQQFTQFIVTQNGAVNWVVKLKGPDAIRVYLAMKVLGKATEKDARVLLMKTGKRFSCSLTATTCEIHLKPDTGDIDLLDEKPKSFPAEMVLDKTYEDGFISIDPKGPWGHFDVMAKEGQKIYENLTVTETQTQPGADFYRKKGKRVDCYRSGKGASDPNATYKCTFFVDYRDGEVDPIQTTP